jgi:hypothetical protein
LVDDGGVHDVTIVLGSGLGVPVEAAVRAQHRDGPSSAADRH